jgi:23S rRNA (uracil1939-C5)-methyltransferase
MERRVTPRCPYYGTCGGCQLQHLAYEDQLELKTGNVREALAREGIEGVELRPTLGMEDPWFYRNKIQFPIREQNGVLQMGYFKRRTHDVVNIKECYIQDPFLTEIAQIARKIFAERELTAYDEKTGKGLLRHFIGRSALETGELLLGIVVNAKGLPAGYTVADEIKKQERLMHRQVARHQEYPRFERRPKIVGVVQNSNLARGNVIMGKYNTTLLGIPFMREKLGRFNIKVGLHSFLQVNPLQTVKLYNLIKQFSELSGEETVVDAYAGIGTIAFWLSEKAAEVIGIEEREEAVKDAKQNIALNKLANVNMVHGLAEKEFPKRADVAVLDPPRGGCSAQSLKRIVRAEPRRIIYVSCNPATLARDLKELVKENYRVEVIRPVDMFPQTEHVEVVVKLSRGG